MFFRKFLFVSIFVMGSLYALPDSNQIDVPSQSGETITHNGITYGTVTSPYTGRVWLDRNLGASRVCTAVDDSECFGDYYQWGRGVDGHQNKNSATTDIIATSIKNVGKKYILTPLYPYDWTNADSNGSIRSAYWSRTDGSSICPIGFRVPNSEEIRRETIDNGVTNGYSGFTNFLKLPLSGYRSNYGEGSIRGIGWEGFIHSTTTTSTRLSGYETFLFYFREGRGEIYSVPFGVTIPVRCIKDTTPQNQPPIANAGGDKNAIIGQSITLSATDSNDNDGNIVSYEWKEGDTVLSKQESFTKSDFSVGEHNITLTVTDDDGASSSDTVMVNILERQDWLVNIDSKYDVSKGEPFGIEFDVNLYDIYPLLGQEERASITPEDIKRDYNPEGLEITLSDNALHIECMQSEDGSLDQSCKILGKIDETKTVTLTVKDSRHDFEKSVDIELKISQYKIGGIVKEGTFMIVSNGEITHHPSFGFDAIYPLEARPSCFFKDKTGNDIEIYMKKVEGMEHRWICSSSYYKWEQNGEDYYGEVGSYEDKKFALVNTVKDGNVEFKITFGDKEESFLVPVYERDEKNANAILEYYSDQSIALFPGFGFAQNKFLVINDIVQSLDTLEPGTKFYLGGESTKGTNNKDFVYISGGVWKLTFQGHEALIRVENNGMTSSLAFTVDGSDVTKRNDIVKFIVDPNSTYSMIMKKTISLRQFAMISGEVLSSGQNPFEFSSGMRTPQIKFSECVSEQDLKGLEPKAYYMHPCYNEANEEIMYSGSVRGTTFQVLKEAGKHVVFNLIEGEVGITGTGLSREVNLTDMTTFDANTMVKKKTTKNTLSSQERVYLKETSLNSIDENTSIGSIKVTTNLNNASYFLIGDNVQVGSGKITDFKNVAEGNYTLKFFPTEGYEVPNDIRITIEKNKLRQDFNISYVKIDTDEDGIPDDVDPDDDNDGILDDRDTFPLNSSEWADTDHDGIGDNADTDDDNDGISDINELRYGLNPKNPSDATKDSDGDGVSNIDEIKAGTDPKSFDVAIKLDKIEDVYAVKNQTLPLITLNATHNNDSTPIYKASSDNTDVVVVNIEDNKLRLTLVENAIGKAHIKVTAKIGDISDSITFTVTVSEPVIETEDADTGEYNPVNANTYESDTDSGGKIKIHYDDKGLVYDINTTKGNSHIHIKIPKAKVRIDHSGKANILLPMEIKAEIGVQGDGSIKPNIDGALLPDVLPVGTQIEVNASKVIMTVPMSSELNF